MGQSEAVPEPQEAWKVPPVLSWEPRTTIFRGLAALR